MAINYRGANEHLGALAITPRAHNEDYPADDNNRFVHPFWGTILTENGGAVLNTVAHLNAEYQDLVKRETGLMSDIYTNNAVLRGLAAPATYLNDKNLDLDSIGNNLTLEYKQAFNKSYNTGKSKEYAHAIALETVRELKKIKMIEHEQKFPTSLTEQVLGRLSRKVRTGNLV